MRRKKQGYEASGFNQNLVREEIAEEREMTGRAIEERERLDRIETSAIPDRKIASIREEIYKIVDSNKLPVNKKKELLDNKVAQLDELFQEKKAQGWVDTNREFGRLLSDIEKLKEGLDEGEHGLTPAMSKEAVEVTQENQELGWYNKRKGMYQFGRKIFEQSGRKRKKVFTAMMDIYEKTHDNISVNSLVETTHLKAEKIRTEIYFISKRLCKKTGYNFRASGQGFYTLEKCPENRSS